MTINNSKDIHISQLNKALFSILSVSIVGIEELQGEQ